MSTALPHLLDTLAALLAQLHTITTPYDARIQALKVEKADTTSALLLEIEALLDCATAHAEALPPTLYEAIMDHLTRTDADGHSLCLAGPLRETLLAELRQWCERWQVPMHL
jgi:hypothetical protein